MICEERLLTVLRAQHVSEKASTSIKKNNTLVLKVARDATKAEIKAAVQTLLKVKVKVVNTLTIKGKVKRQGKGIGCRKNWKKAYIALQNGQKVDMFNSVE